MTHELVELRQVSGQRIPERAFVLADGRLLRVEASERFANVQLLHCLPWPLDYIPPEAEVFAWKDRDADPHMP